MTAEKPNVIINATNTGLSREKKSGVFLAL
jgi:hypothetical protein